MNRVAAAVLILSVALPLPLMAGKPSKKGKKNDDQPHLTVVIGASERERVRSYFVERHGRGNCPPGLAKKNNGCLPPGQAKKRYAVGQPVPEGVVIEELPAELRVRIGGPPAGYRYAVV